MKNTITLLILAIGLNVVQAQQEERFTAGAILDPQATLKDGFNIGFALEYQMTHMYFKIQTFIFPELRGKSYIDYTASVGYNYQVGIFRNYRAFVGVKAGTIFREAGHATYGGELGFEWYPSGSENGFYVGWNGVFHFLFFFYFSLLV